MRKTIAILTAGLLIGIITAEEATETKEATVFRIKTIYNIKSGNEAYITAKGTAFAADLSEYGLNKNTIITAAHNLTPSYKDWSNIKHHIEIQGKWHQLKIIISDNDTDVAILEIEGTEPPELEPLKLTDDGETILIAYDMGENKRIIKSTIERIELNTEVQNGNSGGPVLNKEGKTIGMIIANVSRKWLRGVIVHSTTIRRVIKEYLKGKENDNESTTRSQNSTQRPKTKQQTIPNTFSQSSK